MQKILRRRMSAAIVRNAVKNMENKSNEHAMSVMLMRNISEMEIKIELHLTWKQFDAVKGRIRNVLMEYGFDENGILCVCDGDVNGEV